MKYLIRIILNLIQNSLKGNSYVNRFDKDGALFQVGTKKRIL